MKCKTCNTNEILKINQKEQVKLECKNGHVWNEDYLDNGGSHKRPQSYELNIEDILFPREKLLYKKILNEIEINKDLYANPNSEDIIKVITEKIEANEKEVFKLFKKIHYFNKKS